MSDARKPIVYFQLKAVVIEPIQAGEFRIATAAVCSCDLCGSTIDGMGGSPGAGTLCQECGDALRLGRLRGKVAP